MADTHDVTILLRRLSEGDDAAPEQLMPLVYDDLRRLARGYMQNERTGHTLQATALVHEAYIRLVDWENVTWQNRAHFFAVAAQMMRKILVDHARGRNAEKRGGGASRLALDEAVSFPSAGRDVDLIALDEALGSLSNLDRLQAQIVELRFFGGLTIEETAHALNLTPSQVRSEWTVAKAWLHREMSLER
jgi:RNA polymerase sigma factor (TIGR02999 family)